MRGLESFAPASEVEFFTVLERELLAIFVMLEDSASDLMLATEDEITRRIVQMLVQARFVATSGRYMAGGETDIVVQGGRLWSWIGEAKILRSPSYVMGGVKQLLTRYTSGRSRRAGLLVYCQRKEADTLATDLTAAILREYPHSNPRRTEADSPREFLADLPVASGGTVQTLVEVGNFYFLPSDNSAMQRQYRAHLVEIANLREQVAALDTRVQTLEVENSLLHERATSTD